MARGGHAPRVRAGNCQCALLVTERSAASQDRCEPTRGRWIADLRFEAPTDLIRWQYRLAADAAESASWRGLTRTRYAAGARSCRCRPVAAASCGRCEDAIRYRPSAWGRDQRHRTFCQRSPVMALPGCGALAEHSIGRAAAPLLDTRPAMDVPRARLSSRLCVVPVRDAPLQCRAALRAWSQPLRNRFKRNSRQGWRARLCARFARLSQSQRASRPCPARVARALGHGLVWAIARHGTAIPAAINGWISRRKRHRCDAVRISDGRTRTRRTYSRPSGNVRSLSVKHPLASMHAWEPTVRTNRLIYRRS